jgi:glucosamine-6-phosphate deaminase
MAVPLSPDQLRLKFGAMRKYQSQNITGWISADQNRRTANLYNDLGMAEYEAIEAFAKWR